MEKKYGKLTVEECARLVRKLPELRQGQAENRQRASRLPKGRLRELPGEGSNRSQVYEMPLPQHIGFVVHLTS